MKKGHTATKEAVEIAKIILQSSEFQEPPTAETANSVADFIKTLADRLTPMYEQIEN